MLQLKTAQKPRKTRERARIGLAVAGGGPIGGMYELGALRALDEAIDGLDLGALDVYVGVSSGAFVAAGLANGLDTAEVFDPELGRQVCECGTALRIYRRDSSGWKMARVMWHVEESDEAAPHESAPA